MRRLSYGFIVCSCLFLLFFGYYSSYHMEDKVSDNSTDQSGIQSEAQQSQQAEHVLQPFYLIQISDGKVIIRRSDGSVYETTDIQEDSLPDAVREKIRKEYRLNSSQELYSFLENYSS